MDKTKMIKKSDLRKALLLIKKRCLAAYTISGHAEMVKLL